MLLGHFFRRVLTCALRPVFGVFPAVALADTWRICLLRLPAFTFVPRLGAVIAAATAVIFPATTHKREFVG